MEVSLNLLTQDKKRLIFGVITGQADDSEQKQLLYGMISQAEVLDVDIAVISNIYNTTEDITANSAENKIYETMLSPYFDGFIFTAESFLYEPLRQNLKKMIKSTNLPAVVTCSNQSGFKCYNSNDRQCFFEITEHLIKQHGLKDIDILTGPETYEESRLRTEGYRDALEANGIRFDPSKVHFGDFWYTSGKQLADKYLDGELKMPKALICANDYMAYSFCDTMTDAGIKIPEQISVAGYEYIDQRIYHHPVLSTYDKGRHELGAKAVRSLYETITGKKAEPVIPFKSGFIRGDSCGCGADPITLVKEKRKASKENNFLFLSLNSQFEQKLTECSSFQELISTAQKYAFLIRDIYSLSFCIYENWYDSKIKDFTSSDEHMICYCIKCGADTDYTPVYFNKSTLLPSRICSNDKPLAFYISPVFYQKHIFGCLILAYDKPDGYDSIFRNWIKTFSNALEFLRMKNDNNYLMKCQNLSERYDTVTGLYNESGFINALSSFNSSDKITFVMLKTNMFSDGIAPGEQSRKITEAKEIAKAFSMLSSNDKEIVGRIEQDTYLFAGIFHSDHQIMADRMKAIIIHSTNLIKEQGIDYFACASINADNSMSYSSIINLLNSAVAKEKDTVSKLRSDPEYYKFKGIRSRIYTAPQINYSSSDLCRELCFSEGHFRTLYKKYTGISFHQDCILSRITLAKYLLSSSSSDTSAIASKCGYSDEKYFMRIFRQQTGMTPGQYRQYFSLSQ